MRFYNGLRSSSIRPSVVFWTWLLFSSASSEASGDGIKEVEAGFIGASDNDTHNYTESEHGGVHLAGFNPAYVESKSGF